MRFAICANVVSSTAISSRCPAGAELAVGVETAHCDGQAAQRPRDQAEGRQTREQTEQRDQRHRPQRVA
jgi:hypothetical protein